MADIHRLQNPVVSVMPRSADLSNQLESSRHLQLSGLRIITAHVWDYRSDINSPIDRLLLEWWIWNLRQCSEIECITFYVTLGF
ncbi:uncharacterized protein BT62DRAFT_1007130 [Guyanagaster necrorhizus]|uniref:Uncharacterized protein n=1 Tax=Guyanagaster necrorhizus TaxID=856835 RepID=A0A9P7VST3_9AGAR|nr:uncharacterized protein BT62DRAFT_1007130 [Guyanagaster necrorhizus MCA 3950]KAG7445394.1 hypothetical protein BT62DRAFT_1007130 [Guyanagaster necrorhizus MCA 3950]